MDPQELWEAALGEIELNLSEANFNTWLKSTTAHSYEDGVFVIAVPNVFNKEWLEKKYHNLISEALQNVSGKPLKVKYIIQSETQPVSNPTPSQQPTRQTESNAQTQAQVKTKAAPKSQLTFETRQRATQETGLNSKYLFDNFIVGPSNELAQAASSSVSNHIGQKFNPLFIYGGVGLGKTHLLQAIGNKALEKNPESTVKYMPCEKFTSELIRAIRNQKVDDFKREFQKIDLLIIDDIQFLSGKEKTQEEFFHTFNSLYEANKQIVLSSDRPPKSIPTLESRLRSRFEGGMIADIGVPDYETRLAILEQKTEEKDFIISNEIREKIASQIKKSVRELEGCLNRIMAMYELSQGVNNEKIDSIIKEYSAGTKKTASVDKVISAVAEYFDIKKDDLLQKNRKKEVAFPRQVVMFLLREELEHSFPAIGRKLGDRDHTTAMYGYKKITHRIHKDEEFQQEIDVIRERVYNY